jgi:hypothetical protein
MRMCAASSSKPLGTIGIIRSLANSCATDKRRRQTPRSSTHGAAQQRLAVREKPKQHVVTATTRELTGFVWATLIQ